MKRKNDRTEEFIHSFTYFKIFLKNKYTINKAFNETLKYSSIWMKEKIEKLLDQTKNDKSITPFIEFSSNFEETTINEIMITIYQMIDLGVNYEYLNNFTYMFDELKKNNEKIAMNKEEKRISNKTMYALIGAGIFTLALMIGVIGILGSNINGL